jgi:hypothetical protein
MDLLWVRGLLHRTETVREEKTCKDASVAGQVVIKYLGSCAVQAESMVVVVVRLVFGQTMCSRYQTQQNP